MSFGEFLGEHLRMLGLSTQVTAIKYLGDRGLKISDASLSSYLSGARRPGRGRMEALLDALDVDPAGRLQAYRLVAGLPSDVSIETVAETDVTPSTDRVTE